MTRKLALTGDAAAAYAMKQIEPDVVAAFPITPQTEIVMTFSQYIADGEVDTLMIPVESEHSAMSACVGASAAGARTMTATSANGLALMWEILYIASSSRLPIVMPVVNRALSAPINIHCDHSDTMGARDAGWIQIYCENAREVYENVIMVVRIAEHPDIRLPVMVCQDGFITSHTLEAVNTFDPETVGRFIGEHKPVNPLLDVDNPVTYGPLDLPDYYFEHKRQQSEAMVQALEKITDIFDAFENTFHQKYGFVEEYRLEDAQVAVVVLSSTAGTAKVAVDRLRDQGIRAGVLKPRFMRPFPTKSICRALEGIKAAGVMDRSDTFSTRGGPLYAEITSALYEAGMHLPAFSYIGCVQIT
jgi:pyruvate ferredoxin oxidoreductase alpha subunit